ncbi:hypothetical protein RYX56_11785 [Alkalihalophilus lindianensis]|uniref:Lipoprotein n=1 Tax=Alkalihalophilus lindianensis TaxID=1630542 RepID=A0ABU3XBQ4_9BACI|nr:hypothetical protein [Alkalihalophilus lindianensis]MDV2685052.1 hypothetical protein [Alkalihalophilus lindianensis]
MNVFKMCQAFLLMTFLIVVSACSSEETSTTEELDEGQEVVHEEMEENEESLESEEGTDSQAVAPSAVEETVSFTRIRWTFGSPNRKPHAGIWLYTDEDHPSEKADTFDFEESDYLLYQVSDEELRGHDLHAKRIVLEENDTAKIVVEIFSEPSDSDEYLEMPRQYLEVEKDVLRGKSFNVELEDGTPLSLQ